MTGADAVDGFLAAWRAHLMASWSVDEIDERTTAKGAVVRFEVHQAQNPPDSIEIGNGTVSRATWRDGGGVRARRRRARA